MKFYAVDYTEEADGSRVPEGEAAIVLSPPGAATADMKGLAVVPDSVTLTGDLIGQGDRMRDVNMGAGKKAAWLTVTGVDISAASNLEEAMYITYYQNADYEDNARLNPIEVDATGRLRFYLSGRTTQSRQPLGSVLKNITVAKIKQRIKVLLANDTPPYIKTRKYLWHILKKLRLNPQHPERWKDFVRTADQSTVIGPLKHNTTWTDTFVGTPGSPLSTSPNWTAPTDSGATDVVYLSGGGVRAAGTGVSWINYLLWSLPTPIADQRLTLNILQETITSGASAVVLGIRGTGAGSASGLFPGVGDGYMIYQSSNNANHRLYSNTTVLQGLNRGTFFDDWLPYAYVDAQGSSITGYFGGGGGSPITLGGTDTAYPNAGNVGMSYNWSFQTAAGQNFDVDTLVLEDAALGNSVKLCGRFLCPQTY